MADLEKKKVTELFDLLESDDTEIVAEIKQLIHENLNSTRESWVLNSLFDYYFVTQSKRAMELLAGVQAPHDKHLFDKLNEGLKNSDHKLLTLRLLLFTVFKQPAWIHKLVKSPAFGSVIKCLKNDTDIPTLMTAVLVITMYLPIDAISVTSHLPDIFDIFTRLLAFSKKKPGNIPDIFLLHLQVSVYSLFHRLYGMFPCNFLAYLRYHFSRSENTEVYDDVLKPMIERVRLHPLLITASKDSEVTHKRWRKKENHDILVECARLSLDIIEGTWEEVRCPIAAPRLNVFSRLINERTSTPSVSATSASRLSMGPGYLPPAEPSPHVTPSYWSDTNILWSPSSMCGLSTPPPSHVTSQNASSLDYTCSIQHSFPGTSITNTPLLTTPSQTPRATPPVVVDDLFDRSRNSRSNLSKRLSGSSLSSPKLHVGTSATVQSSFESQASHSVPPSPLRAEFTSEPPAGTHRTQPLPRAAQKLPFDDVSEKLNPEGGMFSYHLANKLDSSLVEKFQSLSQEVISESPVGNDDTAVSHSSLDSDATITENKPRAMSIKVVDKVVQEMKGIHDNADDTDKEVRDIIEDDPSRGFAASESNDRVDSSVQLTAESVQRFMRKVNRIRFNSLTTGNKMEVLTDLGSRVGKWNRSHSCPQLQKEAEEDAEITNQLYRCSSAAPGHDLQPLGSDQPHSANTDQTVPQANAESIPSNSVPNSDHVKASSSVTDVAPVPEDEDPTSQESNQGQSDTNRTKTVALTQSEIEDNAVIEQILPRPFDRILQYSLPYAAITRCQQCKKRYVTALENKDLHSESLADADYEMPLFSTFSPPELLDRHLHLGGEVHAKELSRIPITSQDSINWTHFGGLPPADEINILRGQILLIQNQLMFERHKRELHAKRNRRMLSKITQAKALEERNSALLDQLRLQENEIQSLQVSLKLLQQENQTLKGDRDSDFNIQQVQLRDCVATTGELQYEVSQLKAQIDSLKGEKSEILKMYQAAKGKLFNTEKDVEALQGQVAIAKELQDEIARLNKELLLMGELHQKYQEQLSFKHNRPSHTEEQEYELVSLRKELKARKHQLEQRQLHTSSMQKKILEMEEMLKHKDVTLTDVKRSLEMVKASHQEEIKAVENKYQSSVRIGQQLESHVMELYGQIETLRRSNRQRGSVKVPTSGNQGNQSPISSSSRSQSPYKSQSETSVLSTGSHSNQVYTDKTTRSAVAAWSSPPAVVKSAQMTHPVLSSQFSSGSIGLPSSALLSQSDAFSSSGRVLNQPLDRDRASSESPVMVMETRNTSDPMQTDISGRGDLIGSGISETDQSRDLLELDTDGERTSNSSRSNTLCDSGVETR